MFNRANSIPDVLVEYERALAILDDLGISTHNTRLSRYAPILRRVVEGGIKKLPDDEVHRVAAALLEVSDIVSIASLDRAHLADAAAVEKLRIIRGGGDFAHDAKRGAQDPARETAFEFTAAAHLHEFGLFAGFSQTNGDVLATDGDRVRPVECKRVGSARGAEANLKKGIAQLATQIAEHGAQPGVVFIDVTAAIRGTDALMRAENEFGMLRDANRQLREFVLANRYVLQDARGYPPSCLGVFLRLTVIGYIGATFNLRSATTWHAIDLQRPESAESSAFRALAAALSRFGVVDYDEQSIHLQNIIHTHFEKTRKTVAAEIANIRTPWQPPSLIID